MAVPKTKRVWTIAEAKAKLSEILRLAETEGPQRIGVRKSFILVPEKLWETREPPKKPSRKPPKKPMGQWLLENMPRGTNLQVPDRREPEREIPFIENDTEQDGT